MTDDLTRAEELAEALRVMALPYSGRNAGMLNEAAALLRRLVARYREAEAVPAMPDGFTAKAQGRGDIVLRQRQHRRNHRIRTR